jgi:hypothetical protein
MEKEKCHIKLNKSIKQIDDGNRKSFLAYQLLKLMIFNDTFKNEY